ncbi:hypothetical protein Nans01_03900 [Nocardiopsis ansamitocini]|uniref:Uncharacterized protein n=1 Tax=Nocardiopsis ansamitocini TaxID=1670832 RepID=A0A9W6UGZ6_9ACTN|nr:hypothetical protein Nans01_03900 [Nocardiopsis ansamitocini]
MNDQAAHGRPTEEKKTMQVPAILVFGGGGVSLTQRAESSVAVARSASLAGGVASEER